jgi:hypothetical protein
LLLAVGGSAPAWAGDVRLDGLGGRGPDRILVFVVRGNGVGTPVVAFQDVARKTLEQHTHSRVVSMEEAFVRGGADLQKQLADCRGDDGCYARLAGPVEANLLLVITASKLGDTEVAGARLLDLGMVTAIGNAIDPISPGQDLLSAVADRIRAAVPPSMWDPFGGLTVEVDQRGAEVYLNGKVAGVTPIGRIVGLLPGSYQIRAIKTGYVPATASAMVERGLDAKVALRLEPEETGGAWWIWVVAGVAVAAGGAVALGVGLSSGGEPTFCSGLPGACP